MSAYKEIKTEFRNLESLKKALADLGYTEIEIAKNPRKPDLPLYGYMGDQRPERASVRIPRSQVGRASNDVGFMWNGNSYTAIISQFDSGTHFDEKKQNQLAQRYSYHEIRYQAKLRGYGVREIQGQDGSIRLSLIRR